MNKKIATWAVAITALAGLGVVRAHHSIGMFDTSRPLWVKGTVVRYEPINPHAMVALEERRDGQVKRWIVEGPTLIRLKRMGVGEDFLKVGDVIEVCGFAYKEELQTQTSSANAGGSSRPALHGHVLVMPNGKMRLFGPYGKLVNCIRPDDAIPTWLEFLNRDPLARIAWCNSRTFVKTPAIPPRAFVDEVDTLMADSCS